MRFSVSTDVLGGLGTSLFAVATSAQWPVTRADDCGDGGVAAAIADFAGWAELASQEIVEHLNSLGGDAIAAAAAYETSETSVSLAAQQSAA